MQYFKQYAHDHKIYPTFFGKNDIGFIIYENKNIIRVKNFHPMYNNEAFLYNFIAIFFS